VRRWAAEQPERCAVEDRGRKWTYAELDAASAAVASELIEVGIEPGETVGVCLPRSCEAIIAFLGVLRVGAAYFPVNPEHPPLRQCELVQLAGARVALSTPVYDRGLPGDLVRLDAARITLDRADQSLDRSDGAGGLAYVLFTSGSTGRPKGVEVTHRNLIHLLRSEADVIPRADDCVLQVVPLDFDVSGLEIWGALLNGARLVIAPGGRPDPGRLGRMIAERGVTFMAPSTGLFHELVRSALPDLAGVRLAVPAGDVLFPAAVRALRAAHPQVRLINGYGPTEATILSTAYEVGTQDAGPIPIGRTLPGHTIHLLDGEGTPVENGIAGEIWIGGPCVARGYRHDPDRTAERFLPNPFAPGMMYRTGDRGRWRADGELMFLGRLDRQVKIAGQRVELGEVEEALASHPALRGAAAIAPEAVKGHKHLIAHVVPAEAPAPAPSELRAFLHDRLPAFMVPARFELCESLPVTDRGKVDYAALARSGRRPAADVETSNDAVELVRKLMADLLEINSVGPQENLFEIGGDSLLAIGLVGLIRERTDVELPIDTVFEFPTPSALGDRIDLAPHSEQPRPRLRPGVHDSRAPLSFAQRRAWLFSVMNPGSIAYQFAALLRFRGKLDREALAGALEELLARHQILRTSVVHRGDEAAQVIHEAVPLPLEEIDLRGRGEATRARLIRERVRTRIDPSAAPLVRWTLLRSDHDRWDLVHVENHLVHDGWSFNVLVAELSELYTARVERRSPALPEPLVQFQDYARWERALVASEAITEQLEYWKRTLDPNPPLIELPADRPRGARECFSGGSIRMRMEPTETSALAAAGREQGATLFMAAFAAFAALMRHHSRRDDLQIGSGVANRTEPNSRQLLGMIVNTIVLRLDLGDDPTVAELLDRIRRVALEAYANADAPFDLVVDALAPARDPSRSPLINVLFSFHDAPVARKRWAELEAQLVQGLPNGTAKADLNVIGMDDWDGGLTFVWEHSNLFEGATVERLARQHLELMAQFAARPHARISELEMWERADGLYAEHVIHGPSVPYERDSVVVDLFRERVREAPDAVALDLEGGRWSYSELDERSDRIARRIVSLGVASGDRVGVLAHRSLDCYAALLGVLKAGAAYVALEPDWPAARVALLATDAGVHVVLTDERLQAGLPAGCLPVALEDLGPDVDVKLPEDVSPTSAAYVAYTSGSTGKPKGVEVPHRAVVRLVRGQDWVRLGPKETLLAAAPIAFDASTFEIWGALLNGARLAIFPPEPLTADAVDEVVRRQRVTTLWLTAGLFHRFVELELDTLRAVDQLIAGGDVLSPGQVRRALGLMRPEAVLINGYGPTEATTFTCTHRLPGGSPLEGASVPIGGPLANTHVVIVDDAGRSVPPGAEGELWIGGDGVASGYLGDPLLTRERFFPDPLTGGRFYRTGDQVRLRADGQIEFLGRRDRQLKIRGHRVEPAEVERVLGGHPGVAQVAVEPEEEGDGQKRLVAYYVLRSEPVKWQALRGWLSTRLPTAFVPSRWHELDELPLTQNGKVDRRRLSDLAAVRPPNRFRRAGGPDTLEERLCGIWRSVLDLDAVGPDDDFFGLGGHSLLAVSVFGEIERRLGVELPLAMLFSAPTPALLAHQIRAGGWRESWEPLVPLRQEGSRPPFFCVTAGDGNAIGFGGLARRLDTEQPFYALQPPGLDGRRRFPASVETMADRYLGEIRRVAPDGPYLLGGRCLGTKVALELAQRLHAAGEEVALVAILDDLEGPAAMDVTLPGGVPYCEVLSKLRASARTKGVPLDDIYAPEGGAALLAYAREPVAGGVPRLLHEVWLERPEVRDAFPDIANGDGPGLIDWAWEYGREQLDLPEQLLPPPSTPRLATDRRSKRSVGTMLVSDRISTATEWIDVAFRGRLPGARERREARLRRVTRQANERYRARPYPGRITHLASAERAEELTARRWYDIAQGGVEEHVLDVTHRSMLRVPGVAELARTLDDCVARALR
jgi:amino acid adenylation domain-containing protein